MCEYQMINPYNEKLPPVCMVDNKPCAFCVLGNAGIYNKAKQAEKALQEAVKRDCTK